MNVPHKLYDHNELGNHISKTFFTVFFISPGAIRFCSRSYFGKYHVWYERSGLS